MSVKTAQHVPYSDEIQKLAAKKTNLLWRARRKIDEGLASEARASYEEGAKLEEIIAQWLEAQGTLSDAVIHWLSAASCYMKAEKYEVALQLFDQALLKEMTPELRREIEKLKRKCLRAQKKLKSTAALQGKMEQNMFTF